MSRPARVGLACTALVLAAGCSSSGDGVSPASSAAAVTVQSCGRQLSFTDTPERVVALDQNTTETLLALGAQDRMAGTANLKTKIAPEYAAAYAKIPVLSPKVLTAEPLRAASPDLVVSSFQEHFTADRAGTRDELAALDVPSYVSAMDCSDGVTPPFERLFSDYQNLGRILGLTEKADQLVTEQRATVAAAEAAGARRTPGLTVVWVYSIFEGVPYVAGADGLPSQMSKLAGVTNAFDDVAEEWPEVSWEEVARRDPDVIVIGDLSDRGNPGDKAAEKLAVMREHPVVSQLDAVRDNRIIELPGIEMDPSVRAVNALRALSEGLDRIAANG